MISAIIAVNFFLWIMVSSIIVFGVWLVWRHTPTSRYRRYILFMLMFWGLVSISVYVAYIVDGQANLRFNRGVMNTGVILLGLPCFLTLISYPIAALHPSLLKAKWILLFLLPIIVTCNIYFGYHILMGIDPFLTFPSMSYVFSNIDSPTVFLRIFLMVVYFTYIFLTLRNIWQVEPFYSKYIDNNISNSKYDVKWLKEFVCLISIVVVTYSALVFTSSIYVNTIYILSLIALFVFFIDKLLFTTSFDDIDKLGLYWTFKGGWQVHTLQESCKIINLDEYGVKIDSWMAYSKEFSNINFTTQNIIMRFPELDQVQIAKILKNKGETFHSYVQRFRVNRACKIIEKYKDKTNLKQLSSEVGFSHYSSFSRSFIKLQNISPSEYIALQKDKL